MYTQRQKNAIKNVYVTAKEYNEKCLRNGKMI